MPVSFLLLEVPSDKAPDTIRLETDELLFDVVSRMAGTKGGRTRDLGGDLIEIVFALPFARMPAKDASALAQDLAAFLTRSSIDTWRMSIASGVGVREGDEIFSVASMRAR